MQTRAEKLRTKKMETIKGIDFSNGKLSNMEYDSVLFADCNFSKADLSGVAFIDCTFKTCDMSLVKANNTAFNNAQFINCKLLGIDFSRCKDFLLSFSFDNCILDFATFYQKKIKKTLFNNCSIKEVDFTETDLTESKFIECDLTLAVFENSNIEKVDFTKAFNFGIDLEVNKVKNAKFSSSGLSGLLLKYPIIID
jgi:uncharacterized protein YjbI with pentapeptide repeats